MKFRTRRCVRGVAWRARRHKRPTDCRRYQYEEKTGGPGGWPPKHTSDPPNVPGSLPNGAEIQRICYYHKCSPIFPCRNLAHEAHVAPAGGRRSRQREVAGRWTCLCGHPRGCVKTRDRGLMGLGERVARRERTFRHCLGNSFGKNSKAKVGVRSSNQGVDARVPSH